MPRRRPAARVVLFHGEAAVAAWPLATRGCPPLGMVDELARLQLAARRVDCSIRLVDAGVELSELLDLVGLAEVLTGIRPGAEGSEALEAGGEFEGGEEGGVEEVVVPDDPVA